ncbi:MAG: hypothetical protein V1495_04140 [Pseudomonadota bacterium]
MKTKLIALTLFASLVLVNGTSWAGEDNPQLKSMGVATVLALDPIPADALFYAGKSGQGVANFLIGTLGGFLFWAGMYDNLTMSPAEKHDLSSIGTGVMISFGAILYFPALLWDALGGLAGTAAHNRRVQERTHHSILERVRPTLAVTQNGAFAGAQITF